VTIHMCVTREAGFLCLNGPFTFQNGKIVARPAGANVVIITHDGDVATQVPFGEGCLTRKFFQVILDRGDVCVSLSHCFGESLDRVCEAHRW
jgi:hypothetical protein